MSHLTGFHVFPRENIRKALTVMHNSVLEHLDTLPFVLLACIILCINGKQFRCSVFNFVQYSLAASNSCIRIALITEVLPGSACFGRN